jgi:hypothetical protein
MCEAVLLREILVMIEFEVDPAGTEVSDSDTECAHHRLAVEAGTNSFCVSGIVWYEFGPHGDILYRRSSLGQCRKDR